MCNILIQINDYDYYIIKCNDFNCFKTRLDKQLKDLYNSNYYKYSYDKRHILNLFKCPGNIDGEVIKLKNKDDYIDVNYEIDIYTKEERICCYQIT